MRCKKELKTIKKIAIFTIKVLTFFIVHTSYQQYSTKKYNYNQLKEKFFLDHEIKNLPTLAFAKI